VAALDQTLARMPVAATAGAISLAGAIMADPVLPRSRIFPATPVAEATAVEVTVGEAAMAAAEAEEAISDRRYLTKTGMVAELFPRLFRFIPV
jgi:hypothetical protein